MIILDTNVISELMRARPEPSVSAWLQTQALTQLATTTISLAEIGYGIARLPFGRRRNDLATSFDRFKSRGFGRSIFDFDAAAAAVYGDLLVARERTGRPLEGFDGLIAAIARARGCSIATRNVDDFADCGVALINPWQSGASV